MGLPFAGSAAKSAMELAANAIGESIKIDKTVEGEFKALSKEMQFHKILYLIDDIDRLTPDQALLVFRLVKSVGRLPNVVYVLVFDEAVMSKLLKKRYPSDRQFLEKIVQAWFDVPLPEPSIVQNVIKSEIEHIKPLTNEERGHLTSVLRDVVYPLINLPRDMNRYLNALKFAISAIGEETNIGDLAGIEALRIFNKDLYQKIRKHRILLCGTAISRPTKTETDDYDRIFKSGLSSMEERIYLETALGNLFPRTKSIWGNYYHYDGSIWQSQRRICDPGHFSTFFKISLSDYVLPASILHELRSSLDDAQKIKGFFRRRAVSYRKSEQSELSSVLIEIQGWGNSLDLNQTTILLKSISEIADTLMIGEKANIDLHLHWLLDALVRDRLTQDVRSTIISNCFSGASFRWAISMATRVHQDHFPGEAQPQIEVSSRLVDAGTEEAISKMALNRIQAAATDGTLQEMEGILRILDSWRDFSSVTEVRNWTDALINESSFLLSLAESATGTRTSSFGGQENEVRPIVHLSSYADILDTEEVEKNLRALNPDTLDESKKTILANFLAGLENVKG